MDRIRLCREPHKNVERASRPLIRSDFPSPLSQSVTLSLSKGLACPPQSPYKQHSAGPTANAGSAVHPVHPPLAANPRPHEKRKLLYKALGCLQAALEDSIHFHLKKQSTQMLGYATSNFTELLKVL